MSHYTISQVTAWGAIPDVAQAGETVLALLRDGTPILRVHHAEYTAQTLQAVKLAREFSRRLLAEIGPDALAAVVAENAACAVTGVCFSHDYCDANQVMIDSLPAIGQSYDGSDSEQWRLIDDAWDIARVTKFDA
jgi:hypothetical protein